MADTENFAWSKPTVGGSNNSWGTELNQVIDDIDADLQTVKDTADAASTDVATFSTRDASVQKVKHISFADFMEVGNDSDFAVLSGTHVRSDDGSGSKLYATISLPVGVTLDQVDVICDKQSRTSLTLNVNAVSLTGALTNLGTGSRSATGVGAASAAAIEHTVGDEFLSIEVTGAGSGYFHVYGAKITYTRSNLSQTD